jgi:hypothetical protein
MELGALAGADEAYAANLVEAACAFVERYCKRTFGLTTFAAERHDGGGENALFVNGFPVVAVEKVTITAADGSETEVAGEHVAFAEATGEIRFKEGAAYAAFPRGFQNVAVAYTAGFADVPGDVVEAAAEVAAWLHSRAGLDGISAEKLGDYSRSIDLESIEKLPGTVRRILAFYRNVRV